MTTDLPDGWQRVPLSQLVSKIEAGKSFKCQERPPRGDEHGIVKVSAVTWGAYDEQESKTITDPDRVNEAYLIKPGDFLFSRANTLQLVGACVLVHATHKRLLLSDKILRVVMPEGLKRWVLWFLRSARGRQQIEALSTGNQESMRNIGQERIGQIEVPLPPPVAMQRIVSRIEELFSEIDEGERALALVQKLVNRYRQSVLKAAVTGGLTETWRLGSSRAPASVEALPQMVLDARALSWSRARDAGLAKQAAYPEPTPPTLGTEVEVPPHWAVVSIEAATLAERPIAYGVLQPGPDVDDGVPLVRVCDVADGNVDLGGLKRVAPSIAAAFPRTRLLGGEVLLTIVGTIGRTGIVPSALVGANVARAVAVLSPQPAVRAEWLELCLREERMRQLLTGNSREVARKTLNLEQLRECAIPIPPLDEQDEVISMVKAMLSHADAVAAEVQRQARAAEALRQATLKAAFAGQLVAQDPKDEPASALLARLVAERNGNSAPRRRGRHIRLAPSDANAEPAG